MEIKAALAEARKSQEAQFAKDWQDRLKQLKAEEVTALSLPNAHIWCICCALSDDFLPM